MLRVQDKCTHNKHTHIKVGAVNRQYNETDLLLIEDVGLMSLLVVIIVDEDKATRVCAMKAHRELEVQPH